MLNVSDEKTASLILGAAGLHQAQQQNLKQAAQNATSTSGPPPAHQNLNSSSKMRNMDTLDLRFKAGPPIAAPTPAHKPPPIQESKTKSSSPTSVLDLSSGPSTKKTRRSSPITNVNNANPPTTGLSAKKSGKRIGSRIDALALNLQAKKMMEEKHIEPKGDSIEHRHDKKLKEPHNQHDFEKPIQHGSKSNFSTPPAAHSSSMATSKFNEASVFNKTPQAHMGSFDATKLPPAKANEACTIIEQAAAIRQDLEKWLKDHPEFVAANPSLAAAAAAAMAFNPISSIPANVSI